MSLVSWRKLAMAQQATANRVNEECQLEREGCQGERWRPSAKVAAFEDRQIGRRKPIKYEERQNPDKSLASFARQLIRVFAPRWFPNGLGCNRSGYLVAIRPALAVAGSVLVSAIVSQLSCRVVCLM